MPAINWKALKSVDLKGLKKPSQWFSKSVTSKEVTATPALNKSLEADLEKAKMHNPEDQVDLNSKKSEKELLPTPDGRDSLVKTSKKPEDVLPDVKAEKAFDQGQDDLDHALADYQSFRGFKNYKEDVADLPVVKSQQPVAKEIEKAKPEKDDLTHALDDYAAYMQKPSPYSKGAFDLPVVKSEPAIAKEVEKAKTPEPSLASTKGKPASAEASEVEAQAVKSESIHTKDSSDTASLAESTFSKSTRASSASSKYAGRTQSFFKEEFGDDAPSAHPKSVAAPTLETKEIEAPPMEDLQPPTLPWTQGHMRNRSQESLFSDGASLGPQHATSEFRKRLGSDTSYRDSALGESLPSDSTDNLTRLSRDFGDRNSVISQTPSESSQRKSFFRKHLRSSSNLSNETSSTSRNSRYSMASFSSQKTFSSISSHMSTARQVVMRKASDLSTMAKQQSENLSDTAFTVGEKLSDATPASVKSMYGKAREKVTGDEPDFGCATTKQLDREHRRASRRSHNTVPQEALPINATERTPYSGSLVYRKVTTSSENGPVENYVPLLNADDFDKHGQNTFF